MPAPIISAQCWAVIDNVNGNFLFGKNEKERREIASLTKIMTCYAVLNLLDKFKLDENQTIVKITENADGISGTTSDLVVGDSFSVWELLHAMMLPSGNDASIALAEYFGDLLIKDNYMNSKTPLSLAKPK